MSEYIYEERFNERREEIVRCGDCRFWRREKTRDGIHWGWCAYVSGYNDWPHYGFCYAGEREDA